MSQLTFYCDACGDERNWPRQIKQEKGTCQVCGQMDVIGSKTNKDILARPYQTRQMSFKFN